MIVCMYNIIHVIQDIERTYRLELQQKDIEHQQKTSLLQEEIRQLRVYYIMMYNAIINYIIVNNNY